MTGGLSRKTLLRIRRADHTIHRNGVENDKLVISAPATPDFRGLCGDDFVGVVALVVEPLFLTFAFSLEPGTERVLPPSDTGDLGAKDDLGVDEKLAKREINRDTILLIPPCVSNSERTNDSRETVGASPVFTLLDDDDTSSGSCGEVSPTLGTGISEAAVSSADLKLTTVLSWA